MTNKPKYPTPPSPKPRPRPQGKKTVLQSPPNVGKFGVTPPEAK